MRAKCASTKDRKEVSVYNRDIWDKDSPNIFSIAMLPEDRFRRLLKKHPFLRKWRRPKGEKE